MTTGQRIKALRTEAGITQEALASAARVSLPTVQRLEADRNEARIGTLAAIATALGVPVADLFEAS